MSEHREFPDGARYCEKYETVVYETPCPFCEGDDGE